MVNTKKCCSCRNLKSREDFGKAKASSDGLSGLCKPCALERSRDWRAKNPEKVAFYAACRKADSEKERLRHAKRRLENPEKIRQSCRKWRLKNLESERARTRAWLRENPHIRNSYASRFRASLLQRTPRWLTETDLGAIDFIYALAQIKTLETGVSHHVDHILPLRGKLVSGLHVLSNLQILSAQENQSKSNKWVPE